MAHLELRKHIQNNIIIPVNASSGAEKMEHFSETFKKSKAEAALAIGSFLGGGIEAVKEHMRERGMKTR